MKNFLFWQRWLFITSLCVMLFGLFMALGNSTRLYDAAVNKFYDPVFWKAGPVPDDARAFQQWVYGAWGGTLAGWSVIIAFIAGNPFKRKERWAWTGLTAMLFAWYLLDTAVSLFHGVIVNVVLNTVVGLALLLPLVFTRKHFQNRQA